MPLGINYLGRLDWESTGRGQRPCWARTAL